jgi:hypothetical protein
LVGSLLAFELVSFFAGIRMGDSPVRSAKGHVTAPLHSGAHSPGESSGSGDPLAQNSYFFDVIGAQQPRMQPLLAHQLRVGATYLPVVSTAGGLYRYRLNEALLCTGTYLGAPRLTFVDRALCTSNLVGGNLMAHQVQRAVQQACTQAQVIHRFALCAPPAEDVTRKTESPAPAYTLYLEIHTPARRSWHRCRQHLSQRCAAPTPTGRAAIRGCCGPLRSKEFGTAGTFTAPP